MATNISEIFLAASAQKVWEALTLPELVNQWQYGTQLTTDWKPGSDIRFKNEWEGQTYEQWGKILDVQPLRLAQYSLFAPRPDLADKPENYFVMTYRLEEKDNGVLLTIVQEDHRPGAVQEPKSGEENPILKALKTLVEGASS